MAAQLLQVSLHAVVRAQAFARLPFASDTSCARSLQTAKIVSKNMSLRICVHPFLVNFMWCHILQFWTAPKFLNWALCITVPEIKKTDMAHAEIASSERSRELMQAHEQPCHSELWLKPARQACYLSIQGTPELLQFSTCKRIVVPLYTYMCSWLWKVYRDQHCMVIFQFGLPGALWQSIRRSTWWVIIPDPQKESLGVTCCFLKSWHLTRVNTQLSRQACTIGFDGFRKRALFPSLMCVDATKYGNLVVACNWFCIEHA